MNGVKRIIPAALLLALTVVLPSSLFSLDPQKSIAQYGQNVWLRKNGLPANAVNVVLQTHDGYIWLDTSAGLFRFDGMSFTEIAIDSVGETTRETVTPLLESKDSNLWIGTTFHGLRRIKNGKIYRYGLKKGFFDTHVMSLFESRHGQLLIGSSIGVYKLSDGNFLPFMLTPINAGSSSRKLSM